MPTVPDPFAPADSTGKTTGKSTPGRTRTGQEAIDPATIEASLPNMQWPVKSLGFSGDSTRVAIGRLDSTIVVFDLKSKQTIWQRERLNELGQATVVALTPEGKTLIAGGFRGRLFAWNLDEPDALFRYFAGVDGSAYVVGGAGFTLLKGGNVIMAPIRTGLGLRVGASVGYIRFTPKATWNPF